MTLTNQPTPTLDIEPDFSHLYTIIAKREMRKNSIEFFHIPKSIHKRKLILVKEEFDASSFGGDDGSRTRVQKPIPCSSTIIVSSLTFPPPCENEHPQDFSSFIIRLYAQSLTYTVSHKVDARFLKCECSKADSCT